MEALLGIWLAGVGVQLGRAGRQWRTARRLAREARPLENTAIEGEAIQLGVLVGLGRPPLLREAAGAPGPLVVGLFRPMVVVPAGGAAPLSAGELRMALAHELAHVRRGDLWLALMPGLVQVLFFFHPLVWLACREWTTAREAACDAAALEATQAPPASYGQLLLKLVAANKGADVVPALGTTAGYHTLHGRLKMLKQFTPRPRRSVRMGMTVVLVLGGISVLPWRLTARASQAQSASRSASLAAQERSARLPRDLTARRVWAGPGVDLELSPSHDGRYLPFTDWDTGDLALRDLATGKSRILAKGSGGAATGYGETPILSRDSKQVAYLWRHESVVDAMDVYDLRIIGRDGSRLRVLNRNQKMKWLSLVDWSPDGKQILALVERRQIVWFSAADGSMRVIKTLDRGWPERIRLSPDGHTLAYDMVAQADAPERDIYLLASDGNHETRLVQHPADDLVAGWAPDGQQLLFASDRTGSLGAWRVRIAEGRAQAAPELVMREMGDWSPLRLTRNGSLFYGLRAGIMDVYTATLDPTTGQLLAPPQPVNPRLVGFNSSPAWSPDGRYLAYQTKERDALRAPGYWRWASRVTIRSVESGETRDLSLKHPIRIGQPSWSADGGSLLAFGTRTPTLPPLVYRIDAQTGALTAIPESDGTFDYLRHAVVMARDGKSLFYSLHVNDGKTKPGHALKVRDLETGRDQELYRAPGWAVRSPTLSPDGRQLAFATREAVMVIPTAGGEPRELARARDGEALDWESVVWMPDGRHLLLTKESKASNEVWRIPVAGGEPQRVGLAMPGLHGLSVHPEGRRIAFTAGVPKIELWVMEGIFPAVQTAKAPAPRR
jgi:Tol biopolymer transport system component/beta-lactamase regulating signal transducer with metallopeptidase domain